NRRLAEAFSRCGLVERAGQGMNLMFERSVRQSKPLPDFTGTVDHSVKLALRGNVTNPDFLRYIEQVGEETLSGFDTRDLFVLDHLQRDESVPVSLRQRLPRLVRLGVVESLGRGRGTRYFLSRRFYKAIGEPGAYTRQRGLDREANKSLLLGHIRGADGAGCRFDELQQVLPFLSRNQVQSLLRELKSRGLIMSQGTTRAARWFPWPKTQ
ncbi:MAG: transcriptional regulator, partial [Chloroflexota bacterium]